MPRYNKTMPVHSRNTFSLRFILIAVLLAPAAFGAPLILTPGIAQPRGWEILTGDVWSTVEDLHRWDRALHNEIVLARSEQQRLFASQVAIPGSDLSYGYGWWISDTPFGRLAYHDGHYAGFESALFRYLDFDATIIVLANTRLMTEPRTWISAIRRETEQAFRVRQTIE